MAKRPNNTKSKVGRPGAMPAPRRAPNPRTPKPAPNVRSTRQGGDAGGEATETAEDAQATVGTVTVPQQ